MPLAALGLVLIAAILHATWNLLVKQAKQRQVLLWSSISVSALCCLSIPFLNVSIPPGAWPFILASAAVEALYYITLTWAYDSDDFSLVYPIARGTAPAFLFVWSFLFLNEPAEPVGMSGILLVVVGLIIIGGGSVFVSWRRTGKMSFSARGIIAALATALCISVYTAIDGAAVRFVPAVPYTMLILSISALIAAPFMIMRYGTNVLFTEWKIGWKRIIVVGLLNLLAYVLVLYAYSLPGARVSYAGAVREISVVFGAILGWRLLGEGFGLGRTLGAICMFAGILVIAVFG